MTDIYELHDKAFARVSAFVILKDGERVATVAFKFPADGAGRLYAYVHYLGIPMVRGFAGGYGYDKRSAAVANAVKRIVDPIDVVKRLVNEDWLADYDDFRAALAQDDGQYWGNRLTKAGFTVLQAV